MSEQAPSIRQLIGDVKRDASHLLKTQSELAKTEGKSNQQAITGTGVSFVIAAGAGAIGGLFLLVTLAYVLVALGLPTWAGFGIVTLVLFLTAGIAGAIGAKKSKGIKGLKVTKIELERTKAALTGASGTATDLAVRPSSLPEPRK